MEPSTDDLDIEYVPIDEVARKVLARLAGHGAGVGAEGGTSRQATYIQGGELPTGSIWLQSSRHYVSRKKPRRSYLRGSRQRRKDTTER